MAFWVIPDEYKDRFLNRAIGNGVTSNEDYTLKLYQNNYTPVDGSSAANFTEATFTGYASVAILRTAFGGATIVAHVAVSTAPDAVFTCSGGSSQVVYGAYLVGQSSGKVASAVLFDNARTMTSGSTETVTPTLKDKTFA